MRTLSFPHSPLILATLITAVSFQPLDAKSISVIDPSTGENIELSELDFASLTEEERVEIRDQLEEMGVRPRGQGRNAIDMSEVEVVDPTTGATVALGDIDPSTLSPEDRRNIGDQLAKQGVPTGRKGPDNGSGNAEPDSETSETGQRGRGGEGREGRGGPRG
ncbi:hypothetical protein [Ruegeria atlantica]|uniref:hypothetical protein n=1 Tax=Ruegeria atlantica TaxID=81569 RepID=UPI00147FC216|nr:hypothetical protein [Ruegeria atlantica]